LGYIIKVKEANHVQYIYIDLSDLDALYPRHDRLESIRNQKQDRKSLGRDADCDVRPQDLVGEMI
jgi:hypothetical protein